jgi:outer membrane cobalamin receptor
MKFGKDPEVDRIPSSLVVDLAAGYDLYKKDTYSFRGIASVNNLMNLNYETFVHYPMQGRFISLGLQVSFK